MVGAGGHGGSAIGVGPDDTGAGAAVATSSAATVFGSQAKYANEADRKKAQQAHAKNVRLGFKKCPKCGHECRSRCATCPSCKSTFASKRERLRMGELPASHAAKKPRTSFAYAREKLVADILRFSKEFGCHAVLAIGSRAASSMAAPVPVVVPRAAVPARISGPPTIAASPAASLAAASGVPRALLHAGMGHGEMGMPVRIAAAGAELGRDDAPGLAALGNAAVTAALREVDCYEFPAPVGGPSSVDGFWYQHKLGFANHILRVSASRGQTR